MSTKRYLNAADYLNDIWLLASKVVKSAWRPDILIALWRGGAPAGVAMHEFFKVVGFDVVHIPLKCFSYTGIDTSSEEVRFEHGDAVFKLLDKDTKVLVIDDVFDTGRTAQAVKSRIDASGAQMRIATVYWKPEKNRTNLVPDYYAKDIGNEWLVFPHEIDGLSNDEIAEKNPFLAKLLSEVKENARKTR